MALLASDSPKGSIRSEETSPLLGSSTEILAPKPKWTSPPGFLWIETGTVPIPLDFLGVTDRT